MLLTTGGTTPRPVRKYVRGAAAALVVPVMVVSAAACGDGGSSDSKTGATPAVTGAFGKKPTVAKGEGVPPKKLESKVLAEGKGETVKKGDVISVDYLGQLWNGKQFDTSWQEGRAPLSFEVGGGSMIKAWDEALAGKKLGSRVEIVAPPDKAYGAEGKPPVIPANSTLVFVVDLKKKVPGQIDGKPVEGEHNPDLPKVSTEIEKSKAPSIEMPKGKDEAPEKLISETVVEGDGKAVKEDSSVLVHFTAKMWKDGMQLDDTWQQGGPQEIPVGQLPGWKDALKGKKAGSRVVFSVPKSEFPKEQQKKFGSGVVFSVDLLNVT